jgi:hypothetical protein
MTRKERKGSNTYLLEFFELALAYGIDHALLAGIYMGLLMNILMGFGFWSF